MYRTTFQVYALKKFTGGLGDDDDRESGDKQVWKKYFTKPIQDAKIVVATRKVKAAQNRFQGLFFKLFPLVIRNTLPQILCYPFSFIQC